MEINVFSPGGLGSSEKHTGVDFTEAIIHDLERKTQYRSSYGASLRNAQVATL
jgi:glutathione synthase